MAERRFDLESHLAREHKISPFSTYLKEIVYGGIDGIITTFAVVAGFHGAQQHIVGTLPLMAVLLFGFANLFADGVSMALGNLLSTQSEQDVYRSEKSKELHEIRHNPQVEREESIELLIRKGFTKDQAKKLVDIYATNESYWLDFMMDKELELPNPEGDNPRYMAIATFVSFIGFGIIPLMPYIFLRDLSDVFFLSILTTIGSLILLGALRWKITQHSAMRAFGETLLLGGVAAVVAYFVGTFFRI
jgi:VIT1/CCC1 family predicted Fe2+/Mn2+ transporter